MLDILLGNYIQSEFKSFFETIVYQVSAPAGSESTGATKTTKYLADAENGAAQKAELDNNSFIIFNVWTLCETGHVQLDIIPDADSKLKFRVDATQKDKVTPVMPPMIAQVDLQVDFINSQFQINNTHLILNVVRIPDDQLPRFADFAKTLAISPGNIDTQTLHTHNDIQQVHNDLTAAITLLEQMITLQGGTPQLPQGYTPELIPSYLPKKVCKR